MEETDKEMSYYRYFDALKSVKDELDVPATHDAQGLQGDAETHDDVCGQMTKESAVIPMAGHADSQEKKESTESSNSVHGDNQKKTETVDESWSSLATSDITNESNMDATKEGSGSVWTISSSTAYVSTSNNAFASQAFYVAASQNGGRSKSSPSAATASTKTATS